MTWAELQQWAERNGHEIGLRQEGCWYSAWLMIDKRFFMGESCANTAWAKRLLCRAVVRIRSAK
jgi:hypothetical protein